MKHYMFGLILFGFLPLLYAIIYYFSDVWIYLAFESEDEEIHMWQVSCKKFYYKFTHLSSWGQILKQVRPSNVDSGYGFNCESKWHK